jgi:hypothetical protein
MKKISQEKKNKYDNSSKINIDDTGYNSNENYNQFNNFNDNKKKKGKFNNNDYYNENYQYYNQYGQYDPYGQYDQYGNLVGEYDQFGNYITTTNQNIYTNHALGKFDPKGKKSSKNQTNNSNGKFAKSGMQRNNSDDLDEISNVLSQTNNLNFSTIIDNFLSITKEYISTTLIRDEKAKLNEFMVSKEKIFQMIKIIDKLDNKSISELQYITNFGIPLQAYSKLKHLSKEGNFIKSDLISVFSDLDIRSILMLYKYFNFYSLEILGDNVVKQF